MTERLNFDHVDDEVEWPMMPPNIGADKLVADAGGIHLAFGFQIGLKNVILAQIGRVTLGYTSTNLALARYASSTVTS
jgi:hypothetical protein